MPRRAGPDRKPEINPDVLGYIFEKYINQKQMGAYYTKEDITGYIARNTIIPFILDRVAETCKVAFGPKGTAWKLLAADPDRYLYPAMRHGVIDADGSVLRLPKEIAAGLKDVTKRGSWNSAAASPYALPTETWREHIARRERCLEVRDTLRSGSVTSANDLVTFNLDIRQFAEDIIVGCEGPDSLRALWREIEKITVLDPTCGSGAFLFAALEILQPLYQACLNRMQALIDDADATGHKEAMPKERETLARIAEHHKNTDYFILKSIIINNLYGVDIMEEATEICRLRLFLKLVAQVDSSLTTADIEPLPDIDFNIRAGNALVGYPRLGDVSDLQGQLPYAAKERARIDDLADRANRAYESFRRQQIELRAGPADIARGKDDLANRLLALEGDLNKYLAGEFGVSLGKTERLREWIESHKPFHWAIDFYAIMNGGGFDVVIGNPPYVEYETITKQYSVRGYDTLPCGNLYAYTLERAADVASERGRCGMIVPVSSICTAGYKTLQRVLADHGSLVVSNFNDRPGKLFDGLEHIRLSIILLQRTPAQRRYYSTTYRRWATAYRQHLFDTMVFCDVTAEQVSGALPKVGTSFELSILKKLHRQKERLGARVQRGARHKIYYTRKLSGFVQILDFIPSITNADGESRNPSDLKDLAFATAAERDCFLAVLNSSLFYWFIVVMSDCRNLNKREVENAPFDFESAGKETRSELSRLSTRLSSDIRKHSQVRTMNYKKWGTLNIQCTFPKCSKAIIDQIDEVLGQHSGLLPDEIDFILNFDYKFRMGDDEENTK